MARKKSIIIRITVIAALALFVLFSCRNSLVGVIQEEVEVAVTPPEVEAVYPARSALDIPVDSALSITFSKNIDKSTVNKNSLIIKDSLDTVVSGTYNVIDATVSFTPTGGFENGETYTVTITAAVLDTDGNPLVESFSWTFTTSLTPDETAPIISGVSLVSDDITALMIDEEEKNWMNVTSLQVEISASDNRGISQLMISQNSDFSGADWVTYNSENPVYDFTFTGEDGEKRVYVKAKDGSGNISVVFSSNSLVIDTEDPVVDKIMINGNLGTTNQIQVYVSIEASDSEKGSGILEYRLRTVGDDWPVDWSNISSGYAYIAEYALPDSIVTDDFIDLEVQVSDRIGNLSEIGTASIMYDLNPPSLLETTPTKNQKNVPFNASSVELIFSEKMDPNSFTSESIYVETGGMSLDVDKILFFENEGISLSRVEISGLEINPNTDYIVHIGSEIQDAAGNAFGYDDNWFFQTGEAEDTTAPVGSVEITGGIQLPNGNWIVNAESLSLTFSANDDYNSVYGIKIWGEGDLDPFEETVLWQEYSSAQTWTLDATQRTYSLLYRLQDSAGNISEDPVHVKVLLDTQAPQIAMFDSITGNNYINDPDGLVTIQITASDLSPDTDGSGDFYDGSGIESIKFSNDSTMDEEWEEWSPIRADWTLDIGDGTTGSNGGKEVFVSIKDYMGNEYTTPVPYNFTWDTLSPEFVFNETFIEVNETMTPSGTLTEDYGVAAYLWEQEGGGEELTFGDSEAASTSISANADGDYIVKLTIEDNAGNIGVTTVPFIWDTVAPDDITYAVLKDSENQEIVDNSYSGEVVFISDAKPTLEWNAAEGAQLYRIIFGSPDDTSAPDWSDYESYEYSETSVNYFSAPDPANLGDNDGKFRFYLTAWDNAGNKSNLTSNIYLDFGIDTLTPVITNSDSFYSFNQSTDIDYSLNSEPSGDENAIYDPANGSGSPVSGIDSILWTVESGTGMTIDQTNPRQPVISSTEEGLFEISVTVADSAGNTTDGNFTVEWDTIPPNAPVLSGIYRTSNQQPTWSWVTGGGGNGTFQFRIEYSDPDPESFIDYGSYGDWTTTENLSFTPPSILPDNKLYKLYLREFDRAGNYSDENYAVKQIWVDTSYTAVPPVIALTGGDAVRIIGESTSVEWTWTTGISPNGGTYRYKLDNNDLSDITTSTDNTSTFSILFAADGSADGWHTLYVEEWNSIKDGTGDWEGLVGEHSVLIDQTKPAVPTMTVPNSPTIDYTPTWTWAGEENAVQYGGTGVFQYRIDGGAWSSETTAKTATLSFSGSDGNHTFEVRERDAAGNWSDPVYDSVLIDTTAPTVNSVIINEGSGYTNVTAVTVNISASSTDGEDMEMRFYHNGWLDWEPYSETKALTLLTSQGPQGFYLKFRDYLGNESGLIYYSVIYDVTPPYSCSVTVNSGDTYTPSLDCNLQLSASDNYSTIGNMQISYWKRDIDTNNYLWSDWVTVGTDQEVLADINFTPTVGTKTAYVRFKDQAGNVSADPSYVSDSIYLQIPEPTYAIKGNYYNNSYYDGYTYVYYNPVTEPAGANTTKYYTYSASVPNADPNVDPNVLETQTYDYNTTSTSYARSYIPHGELRYIFVRAYNLDSGGWGPYSLVSVLGFTSHVTIIYDDDDSTDITRAEYIKDVIEDTLYSGGINSLPNIAGTLTPRTVTLMPEDLVDNIEVNSENYIYGDPSIITTGTYFPYYSTSYDTRIRNIAGPGKGVIGLGYNGYNVIDRIDKNWDVWGFYGTKPNELGRTESSFTVIGDFENPTTYLQKRAASISEEMWHTPMSNLYMDNKWYETTISLSNIFGAPTIRYGVEVIDGSIEDGAIYAGDSTDATHYPIVRQGRFLVIGSYEIPNPYSTSSTYGYNYAHPFFLNLIERMSQF